MNNKAHNFCRSASSCSLRKARLKIGYSLWKGISKSMRSVKNLCKPIQKNLICKIKTIAANMKHHLDVLIIKDLSMAMEIVNYHYSWGSKPSLGQLCWLKSVIRLKRAYSRLSLSSTLNTITCWVWQSASLSPNLTCLHIWWCNRTSHRAQSTKIYPQHRKWWVLFRSQDSNSKILVSKYWAFKMLITNLKSNMRGSQLILSSRVERRLVLIWTFHPKYRVFTNRKLSTDTQIVSLIDLLLMNRMILPAIKI